MPDWSSPFSLHLPLKIAHHHLPHPHPERVAQVQLVMVSLTGSPLTHTVVHYHAPRAIRTPVLVPPNPQCVEVGDVWQPVLGIKIEDVIVQLLNLVLPVPEVAVGHGAVVGIPDKLRGTQEGSHSKLVFSTRMKPVLQVDHALEVADGLHDGLPCPPLGQVVKPCDQQYPHWLGLVVVIKPPGEVKISYFGSRNSEPVYMAGVRRADNTPITRLVEMMELGGTEADVKPIIWPRKVGVLAGGAQIHLVGLLILHVLVDPVLLGGVVLVVHGVLFQGDWLPVGADLAQGGAGLGQGGRHFVLPGTNQSTT